MQSQNASGLLTLHEHRTITDIQPKSSWSCRLANIRKRQKWRNRLDAVINVNGASALFSQHVVLIKLLQDNTQ